MWLFPIYIYICALHDYINLLGALVAICCFSIEKNLIQLTKPYFSEGWLNQQAVFLWVSQTGAPA